MEHPGFFERAGPYALSEVAAAAGAEILSGADPSGLIDDVRPLSEAGPSHSPSSTTRNICPSSTRRRPVPASSLRRSRTACRATTTLSSPSSPITASPAPWRCSIPLPCSRWWRRAGAPPIDPTATLEAGVIIEPGAIIGREAQIGAGTRIAAGAVIGARVTIGRDCFIGAARNRDARTRRRPGDHPFRRPHRPGRLRLRHGRPAATSRCRRSAG